MTRQPPRAVALVNNELEVGYDIAFETRWAQIETGGRVLMTLLVLAALLGLLGQGPLSHRTQRSADNRLAVDFEPVARYGTTTQITLHLSPGAFATADSLQAATPVHVTMDHQLLEPMGLQHVFPLPAEQHPLGADVDYSFVLPAGADRGLVRFIVKPNAIGPIHLQATQPGRTVSWTQWVLP